GDAVRMAHHFVGDENFLLCAGDTYIVSANNNFLQRLLAAEPRDSRGAALLVQRVDDPRQYGVVVAERRSDGLLRVSRVVEKPSTPPSNLAIMPFYVFTSYIMKALDKTPPGVGGEVQLTDAVELLIEEQGEVFAVSLADDELRLDIGTPETYLHALKSSYQYIGGGRP
ncbi:MAG: sugar phosphate nucleotidyltransferase, partial [Candidatus Caldarchaeum sp.]